MISVSGTTVASESNSNKSLCLHWSAPQGEPCQHPLVLPGSPWVSLAECTAVQSSLSSPAGNFGWLGKCSRMASHPFLAVVISPSCSPWRDQSIVFFINRYPHPSQAHGAHIREKFCCCSGSVSWPQSKAEKLQTTSSALPGSFLFELGNRLSISPCSGIPLPFK